MRIKNLVINLALAAGGLVMLLPFAWMLSLSLKPENEIYTSDIAFLPREWDFANYIEAWTVGYAGTFVINGVIVTLGILVLQYLTIIPAAYVLARKNFRLRGLISWMQGTEPATRCS